ncbi:hypothetical protein [Streptomyces alboflavus]|uniref:hypothetical protein n=1 Tax=Streptomyces alboflavus TaxID=67267 RepID=UPI0036B3A8A4
MITTIPIGSWYWEAKTQGAGDELAYHSVRDLLGVWGVMVDVGLARGNARADIRVQDRVGDAAVFTRRDVQVAAGAEAAGSELLMILGSVAQTRSAGLVTIDLSVPGVCLHGGERVQVEKLFLISVDVWPSGAATIALHAFSDVWMTHDLRGRKHPDVQRENAPLLAAALAGIARFLGVDIIPGDATSYGVPSETGFEDLPDEDPDLLDSWYMFEVPRRTEELQSRLPSEAPQFATETDLPVSFVEIAMNGETVGYLWAADGDNAAGYEPYTPAGDVSVEAGVHWLEWLSDVKASGAAPSHALRLPAPEGGESTSGMIVPGSQGVADSLEDLQELSGREGRSLNGI